MRRKHNRTKPATHEDRRKVQDAPCPPLATLLTPRQLQSSRGLSQRLMALIARRRLIRFQWGQNRTAAVSRAMLDGAVWSPSRRSSVSFDTWYDLRAGLSTTRPSHQHHRAAVKTLFDLQETDTSEPREYRNYPFLFGVQSLVVKREWGSIKIPASIWLSLPHSVVTAGHHARGDQKIFPKRSPYLIW